MEKFVVYYTKRPPRSNLVAGRLVDEALFRKVSPALAVSEFTQHEALHDAEEPVVVSVINARQHSLSLHKDGFTMVSLSSDLDNTRERLTSDVAMKEAIELVKASCPDCTAAVAFDVTYRNSARNNRNSSLGPGGYQSTDSAAVGRVHADFTPFSAVAKIQSLIRHNPQVTSKFSDTNLGTDRIAIINVWRPLGKRGTVVRHKPLGLLHPASVQNYPFPYALVYEKQAGTNASLDNDPTSHSWYYYKDMTPYEALLFYNFNQGGSGVAPEGTFHAALHEQDEESGELPPPRESVEVRVLVRWR